MEENRFFKWLGRANAIILFFAGIAILVALVGYNILPAWRGSAEPNPSAAAGPSQRELHYMVGELPLAISSSDLTLFDNTNEGMMVLTSRSFGETNVNILIVNLETMKSRWMFPGNRRSIGSVHVINSTFPKTASNRVVGLVIPVASSDTDKDGEITNGDEETLYLYRPGSGSDPVPLLTAKSANVQQLSSERMMVLYNAGRDDDRMALYSIPEFKRLAGNPLAAVPK
jgi:hypothetical protein